MISHSEDVELKYIGPRDNVIYQVWPIVALSYGSKFGTDR